MNLIKLIVKGFVNNKIELYFYYFFIFKIMDVNPVINLDDSCPRSEQPLSIKLELKTHQLTLAKRCRDLEDSSNFPLNINNDVENSNVKLKSKFGVICDSVGSGKTLSVLSLIAAENTLKNKLPKLSVKSNLIACYEENNTEIQVQPYNIIVVPHTIFKQWKETIDKHTDLKCYGINNSKTFDKFVNIFSKPVHGEDDEAYKSFDYQIILISNTRFNDFMYLNLEHWKSNNTFSRYIFDEADVLKISRVNNCRINASFIWFVTSSYNSLLNPHSRSMWRNSDGQLSYYYNNDYRERVVVDGLKHSGFIKSIMIDIISFPIFYQKQLFIKNADEFVKNSFELPEYVLNKILCETPNYLKILDKNVSQDIIEHLQGGDIKGAIEKLDCKTYSKGDLIKGVTNSLAAKLRNLEIEFKMKSEMSWSSENAKKESLLKIKIKISNTTKKIESIEEKLQSNDMCSICYDDLKTTSVTPCCNTKFCLECISQWLHSNKSCPFCRESMDMNSLIVVSDIVKPVKSKLLSKIDNLEIILKKQHKNPIFKMLIFSDYNNSFNIIETLLKSYNINYANVNGTTHTINKKLRLYKDYESSEKIDVLLLNANYCANGINLENTTDIVLYHSMNKDKTKQIIGRGQRPGRTSELNVWNLRYENELN